MLLVTGLETEYSANPLGIGSANPRYSWRLESPRRGARQSAYRLQVAGDRSALLADRASADSGPIPSDASRYRPCLGPPLASREQRWWRVAVRDELGDWSDWSEPAWCEAGLLDADDWKSDWIAAPPDWEAAPLPLLATAFELEGPVQRARLYASALGLYTFWLNGEPVGDAVLAPGWTSYAHRIPYLTYDVTPLLAKGRNSLCAMLGKGWWGSPLGLGPQDRGRAPFGKGIALRAQLEIEDDAGVRRLVAARAADWRAAPGPILAADLYDGESQDLERLPADWPRVLDTAGWAPAVCVEAPAIELAASGAPPVRRIETLDPASIAQCGDEAIVDFGQILTGWTALDVAGSAGQEIVVRHAELLDSGGALYTANLRSAAQTDRYRLRGERLEHLEPRFTLHGFRYAAIRGLTAPLLPGAVRAVRVHSDLAPGGTFSCSDPMLNQLQLNIVAGQRGNFVHVPTDCPQRDERQGWTGDAQVFAPTAAFNYDVRGFFSDWLTDLALDQGEDGSVSWVVPDIFGKAERPGADGTSVRAPVRGGTAGWGDAATIVPWTLYTAYGDIEALRRQFASMRRWADYQASRAGPALVWRGDFQFGDWLDFFAKDRGSDFGSTPEDLVATAYFARSTAIVGATAHALGETALAARYCDRHARICTAFTQAFALPSGIVGTGTQTGYVLALDFDLLPPEVRPRAAARLAEDVRARGHLTTGFLGTARLLPTLARFGYAEDAFRLLLRRDYPSWLYPVTRGATTIWERWDGIKPGGAFASPHMNSFNHYAYGAVGAWLYAHVAGIAPDSAAPGYRRIIAAPQPGGGLRWAAASLEGPYGRIDSRWSLEDGCFRYALRVPPGSDARVTLPGAVCDTVRESGLALFDTPGISNIEEGEGACRFEAAAGRYAFEYPMQG